MNIEEVIKIINHLEPYDLPYSSDNVYIAIKKLLDLYLKEKEKNNELEEDRNYLLIEGAKLVGDKEILKQTFKDSTKMFYIHKDKLRKIIYPSPENPIPIEVQQSEMYKKLVKEVEETNNE